MARAGKRVEMTIIDVGLMYDTSTSLRLMADIAVSMTDAAMWQRIPMDRK